VNRGLVTLTLAALAGAPACYAEVDSGAAAYPPPSFVATAQPVYYEGHPTYFYNGHWTYRDASGRWTYYRTAPRDLEQRRAAAPARRAYERPEPPRQEAARVRVEDREHR